MPVEGGVGRHTKAVNSPLRLVHIASLYLARSLTMWTHNYPGTIPDKNLICHLGWVMHVNIRLTNLESILDNVDQPLSILSCLGLCCVTHFGLYRLCILSIKEWLNFVDNKAYWVKPLLTMTKEWMKFQVRWQLWNLNIVRKYIMLAGLAVKNTSCIVGNPDFFQLSNFKNQLVFLGKQQQIN